jgi:hypothetical protein
MDKLPDKKQIMRRAELAKFRENILSLPPEKALDRILQDPHAIELVHSFPEQDLYLLIHDIGPEDALPLMSLASNKQWEHLVDLEVWQRDSIDTGSVTRWMHLLMEADPKRFVRWVLEEKLEFIEFYLFRNIEVRVREHDEDPSDFGKDFFSLDSNYYVRFIGMPPESESDKLSDDMRKQFIEELLERLAGFDHRLYQKILLEATSVIPAEAEELSYKWRNVRLAEKGFLPFDEAIGIYQPLKPRQLREEISKPDPGKPDDVAAFPVPQYPLNMLKEDNPFTRALAIIDSDSALQEIQAEFANLCNQIIVADQKTIREREGLREIVRKACGYISIGLERLKKDNQELVLSQAAALLKKYALGQIFKVGFGGALELKWRADKWVSQSWFARTGLPLTFWGERWLGVLGGLLIKKPLYFDNYKSGMLYREFVSLDEIRQTEHAFNQIKAADELLSLLNINIDSPSAYGFLTYKNLILTLWARHCLGLSTKAPTPLALEQFRSFYENLFPGDLASDTGQPRNIPMAMKASFLEWLSAETGLEDFEISARVGQTFEDLFIEIESEFGRVAAANLDPRYVQLFLLK